MNNKITTAYDQWNEAHFHDDIISEKDGDGINENDSNTSDE